MQFFKTAILSISASILLAGVVFAIIELPEFCFLFIFVYFVLREYRNTND